jgi:two-component system, NarL family, response regulator NreC
MLLNSQADMKVVGEAADGEQALEQVRLKKPDILLVDISMPGTGGLEVVTEIKKRSPHTRAVVLTMHAEPAYLHSALAAGACGYVLKRSLDADLVSAIRGAYEGKTSIDAGVAEHLVERALGKTGRRRPIAREAFDLLSRREQQVLRLVAEGYTNAQIAAQVFVGVKSVETYRARVLKKLHIKTRREITQFAIDSGLLSKTRRKS